MHNQASSYIYSFYRPQISGEISSIDGMDFNGIDSSKGSTDSSESFSQDIQQAYEKVCNPQKKSNRDKVLMLTTSVQEDIITFEKTIL